MIVELHSVRTPVGFGIGNKNKGRPLSVMAHLKKNIVEVKARAIVLAIEKLTNDTNYNSYRRGWKIFPVDQKLLQTTQINLDNGAGILERNRFQEDFREYRVVV
jgi:hypothetical protein